MGLDFSDCLISENEKKIGWLCTYTPEEIIHAAGFQPVRLSGKGNPIKSADACLHNNLCPFVRSVLDDVLDDSSGKFDGIIFVNSCDAIRRLYDAWQTFIKADFTYILDPPKSIHSSSITHYADQLRCLVQSLEQHYGVTITAEIDIPFLNVDLDIVDPHTYSPGQIKTRLQSFVEMSSERQASEIC